VEWLLSGSGWLRLLMAVIVTGIVLTHSRMGNTSLFVSLTFIGVIWLWRNRSSWLRSFILVGSLLLIDALILGTWFGLDNVVERLQQTQTRNTAEWIANELEQRKAAQVELTLAKEQAALSTEEAPAPAMSTAETSAEDISAPTIQAAPAVRATPAPVTPSATKPTAPAWKKGDPVNEQRDEALPQLIKMAKDYAITGIGLGNFSTGFTQYNRLNIAYFYNEAHCDYLQFIIETGVVGTVLLGLLVLYCAGCGFITLCFCHSRMLQGVGFAVSMTTVASLMHAWVDYNFQSTATASLFVVIMAIGVVSRALPDTVRERSRKR
jgi:O-antigen ligase